MARWGTSIVEASAPARPLVKAAGGKTKLLPEILPRLPDKIVRYHEPFFGGGAVFFGLLSTGKLVGEAFLSDMNGELVNLYRIVQSQPHDLIELLRSDGDLVNEKAAYYRVRAREPGKLSRLSRAARILYLNKTCFNGLHRTNRAGKFNVPFGSYENPTICDDANILAVSKAFVAAWIDTMDFDRSADIKSGDVVYFDPPYLPLSATSNFTSYTKEGFNLDDHVRLRDVARALGKRGVHVLLSHSAAPAIRELYAGPDFLIEEVKAARSINSDPKGRGEIKELLITVRRGKR